MKDKVINIAVIGHGFMGHEHEKMLSDFPGYRLVGFYDRESSQLEDVLEGEKRYSSVDELVGDRDVDVVLIAANNNQHFDLVKKAAEAKKDIICEKPAAMSVKEFDRMMEIVKANGVKFTVHHQRRLDPDFRTIKEVYDSKTLGEVYTIKNQLYGFNGNMHDWHVYISEGGGMLYDWGVHLLDQVLYMVKEKITSVYATMRNVINFEVDDFFNIQLRFESGLQAEIELGTYYLRDDSEHWFERHWFIGGNKGTAYTDGFDPKGKIVRTTGLLINTPGSRTMTAAGPTRSFGNPRPGLIVTEELPKVDTSHRDYFTQYHDAYFGDGNFAVKPEEVRRVLALMEAVRESARTGQSVPFEK